MADDAPRRRSRFDQTEPARPSRFDRRSRSPSGYTSQSRRSRSPVSRSVESPDSGSKTAAAAAAAAKITAQIKSQKASGFNTSAALSPSASGAAKSPTSGGPKNDIYQQDGDYIKDIEVNDLRNRYTLTRGPTQKMIKDETGADVTTRGNYYPDKSMATANNPPLYLHITSTSREGLEQAIAKIEDMMKQELPNLVDERRFRRREPREEVERDEFGRRKWPEEKIPVDLEPIPGFNLRAQVVGHQGTYVKHIQGETRCRVQIKGRGSGFNERDTNMESDEPMYLHVSGPNLEDVQTAKGLCEDLLKEVREQYQQFKARGPNRRGPPRENHDGYGQSQNGHGANPMSPGGAAQQDANDPAQQQYSQWYSQVAAYIPYYDSYVSYFEQNPDSDPFKEQGGFQQAVAYYYQAMQQYYQQQPGQSGVDQQQQQPGYGYQGGPYQSAGYPTAGSPAPGADAYGQAPPPPPPGDEQPPPPPPPAGGPPGTTGSYNAVPPPPNL